MEFFTKNPKRNIKHPEIVDWVAEEWKKRTGVVLRDPDRQIRQLSQKGLLQKISKGVYRYDPDFVVNRELEDFTAAQKAEILKRDGYRCVVCGQGEAGGEFEGMYRFQKNVNVARENITTNTPLGKFTVSKMVNKTENNAAYSHYLTFRVMKESSIGWQHGGISAKNILKETRERIEAPIMNMLKDGVRKDLAELGFRA